MARAVAGRLSAGRDIAYFKQAVDKNEGATINLPVCGAAWLALHPQIYFHWLKIAGRLTAENMLPM